MKPVIFLGDSLGSLRAFPNKRVAMSGFNWIACSADSIPMTGSR